MNFIPDPANAIVGILSIIGAYLISRSGKEDAKKFADAAQKAADETEKNRLITQRASVIPHIVIVEKTLKAFDDKMKMKVGKLREMHDSLLHLFIASDKFNFLKPIEPLVEKITKYVTLSLENDIANHWCSNNEISKDFANIGLKNMINELQKLKKDFDLGL